MNTTKKTLTIAAVIAAAVLTTASACESDADIASENVSKAADNFEVNRRIVVFNGITDEILLTVTGPCSITDEVSTEQGRQLEIICKTGEGQYVKHFAGISDNVAYFAEQGDPVEASAYNYRIVFKPQAVIPDPDFRGSMDDGPRSQ